jgi:K+-transporting ATPase KdpF subunit
MSGTDVCGGVRRADDRVVRDSRPDPAGGGAAVIANLVGLVLAVAVAGFMVAALLFPERF